MALYKELSYDQVKNILNPQQPITPVQDNTYNLIGQKAGAQAATRSTGPLESFLGGLGNTISNVGMGIGGLIGGGFASGRDLLDKATGKQETLGGYNLDRIKEMIDLNEKIGGNSNATQSLKDIYDNAKQQGKNNVTMMLDDETGKWITVNEGKHKDEFMRNFWGTKDNGDINYAKAAGTSLDAAATLSNFIPGANGIVGNALQGAASGFGQTYADTGGDLEAALKSAAASGLAGGATGGLNKGLTNMTAKGGKLASFAVNHPLANTIARGGLSGMVGGAVGGGAAAGLNNGDILTGASQGAGSGLGGGLVSAPVMYGANKLISKTPVLKGIQGGLNELEQDYQTKQQLKKVAQQTVKPQPIEETLAKKTIEPETQTVEETQIPIKKVARPEKDRVYASQLMDDTEFDDGIRSVKFNNEDIANSVAKDTGLDSILRDREMFDAAMASTPETDPTGVSESVLPQKTRELISESLDSQNLTPKSYKKSVANKLTDFILGEGNQGVDTVYYRDPTDDKITGSRRVSNNSKTYKLLYDEYGGKPSKEFINATVDDYLSGRMDKVSQQKFENALEWDRNAFDSANIPEKGFKKAYESTGVTYDNLQKALENDSTLRGRINKSLLDNSDLTMPMLTEERLKATENAATKQAQLDADYDARKAVAQAQADEINRQNGWDEYDQYLAEINARGKSKTIPKINRERRLADDSDIYNNAKSKSYRKKEAQTLLNQYNTVDKKTAYSTDPEDTVLKLKDMGFSNKSEIEDISGKITGKDGKLTGLVKKTIENTAPIDTTTGPEGYQTMDEYVDDLIAQNGLSGLQKGDATKQQINAIMNKLKTRREGSIDFVDDGSDVFGVVQKLERAASEKRGKSGTTYATATDESLAQANVLEGVADELRNRIFDNADVEKVLTPDVADELKSYAPKNAKWADYVDNTIMKSQDARQLRAAQSPWVRINKIIENGDMNQVTYGGRVGNAYKIPTTEGSIKNRVINEAFNRVSNSNIVRNTRADYYENQAKKAAGIPTESVLPTKQVLATETLPGTVLPIDRLGNAIGRAEGARAAGDSLETQLANMNTTNASQATATGLNGAYYAGATGTNGTTTPTTYSTGYNTTASSGNDMLSRIEVGIQNAFNAGDFESVEYLMDMYSNIAKMYKTEEPKQVKLSATQQRANAAAASLQRLANMTPDTGYTLSGIPVVGNVTTLGGNSYLSEAQSLAQQIGYMVSGANIKKEEAEAIGKAYVPQPFDSEQIRNEKLQRAAEIIALYQQGYVEE